LESAHATADSGALAKVGLAKAAKAAKAMHDGVDHGAGGTPVRVGPHGDEEIQWRGGLAHHRNRSVVEVFALGQADVTEGWGDALHYLRAGLSYEYALTSALALQIESDVPVTVKRRSEVQAGLSVRAAW
jgi:hypothetical protein